MSDPQYVNREDEVQLAKLLRESGPWIQRHGTSLIYVAAAVLAASAVYVYVSRQPPATARESALLLAANTPEQFAGQIKAEFEVYKKVVAEQNLTLD